MQQEGSGDLPPWLPNLLTQTRTICKQLAAKEAAQPSSNLVVTMRGQFEENLHRSLRLEQEILVAGYRDLDRLAIGDGYADLLKTVLELLANSNASPATVDSVRSYFNDLKLPDNDIRAVQALIAGIHTVSGQATIASSALREYFEQWGTERSLYSDAVVERSQEIQVEQQRYLSVLWHKLARYHRSQVQVIRALHLAEQSIACESTPLYAKQIAQLLREHCTPLVTQGIIDQLCAAVQRNFLTMPEIGAQGELLRKALLAQAKSYQQERRLARIHDQAEPSPFLLQLIGTLASDLHTSPSHDAINWLSYVLDLWQEQLICAGQIELFDVPFEREVSALQAQRLIAVRLIQALLSTTYCIPTHVLMLILLSLAEIQGSCDHLVTWTEIVAYCYHCTHDSEVTLLPDELRADLTLRCAQSLRNRYSEIASTLG